MKKVLFLTYLLLHLFQTQALDFQDTTRFSNSKLVKFFTSPKYIISPFAFYLPETDLVIGVGLKKFYHLGNDSTTRTSNVASSLQYSLNGQFLLRSQYQIFAKDEKYYINGVIGFSRFPITFYGIGNQIDMTKNEPVTYDYFRFENLIYRKIGKNNFAGLGWRYLNTFNVKTQQNGKMETEPIEGNKGSTISGLNISYLFDNRDNILNPSRGFFSQVTYSIHGNITGSSHTFNRWLVDARYYLKPFRKREDVLAFQGYGFLTNGNVPFNELAQMGGDIIMRGYFQGSYRDKNLLAFQSEYRLQLLKRWGIVGFAGAGGISNEMGYFELKNIMPSYGGGLRFKINRKENVNLRMDYGFGNGQQNIYFFIAEAF
ncbi:MAG: hypothetical protein RLZZ306_491 [Bacteroidota bacterium]|jgi:outer membrane protein assembly factor BamA